MLRVSPRVLLLITAHLTLLCAELSHTEETSSISGREGAKPASCGKDCEDRTRKRSTPKAKCELYYFAPTASDDELFAFWNNTKAEQLQAFHKIVPFLQENRHEGKPIFFPAHLPLVEKRDDGRHALVLRDVYVRANGTCGNISEPYDPDYYDTNPAWYNDTDLRLEEQITMLEDYVERVPRSHWGLRAPRADENDVCLDDTGLVVKDFPGIRTCFSMWIYDYKHEDAKHFAGRQIYNRVNQTLRFNIAAIGFDPSRGNPFVEPIETDSFSLAALFLKEMCHITNEPLENRCTYWTTVQFYVSLCCCYTNRTECAYRTYKFPSQKKEGDTKIRACATGSYYAMKSFGGNHEPKNASEISSSVKQFVQERTSSEFCGWTYTWDPRDETPRQDDVLRVDLDAVEQAAVKQAMRDCTSDVRRTWPCCNRTTTLCPFGANSNNNTITIECVCSDGDLCNKRHSYMDASHRTLIDLFHFARPCEAQTAAEHLLLLPADYKKTSKDWRHGYMCPVFYNFAHPGRPNAFLQLAYANNFRFVYDIDRLLFQEDGCQLVEVDIKDVGNCSEKLFGEHDQLFKKDLLILLCSVEGNPLGERRTPYPDAELKRTIEANLTAAKEAFPTCKTDFKSIDFESVSELVEDNSKLERWLFDDVTDGTNDHITTAYCYVEVSFLYQQQYNYTFGAASIDNKALRDSCHESERREMCVQRNSIAEDEHQRFTCCCRRNWRRPEKCRVILLNKLKTLLNENVIAEESEEIMSELVDDPLTKCFEEKKIDEGQAGTEINRPCARNDGCYTAVHAREVPTSRQHKEHVGCVSQYSPDAKKRDETTSHEVEARFYRICRLPRNQDQCFAILGTEDVDLPDDVKGPQMVCCCAGRLDSAQKCDPSQQFGMKIGDFH